eukprot:2094173-Prymnesium_polylepis.1
MSLTTTAMRTPARLFSMWLSSVVLPAPRKPERTVTGSVSRTWRVASCTALYGLSSGLPSCVVASCTALFGLSGVPLCMA